MVRIVIRKKEEKIKEEVIISNKRKKKNKINDLIKSFLKEEENPGKEIFRNPINQAVADLKIRKMNGDVLTSSISEILKAKEEEKEKDKILEK